jgi:hypothetical protein
LNPSDTPDGITSSGRLYLSDIYTNPGGIGTYHIDINGAIQGGIDCTGYIQTETPYGVGAVGVVINRPGDYDGGIQCYSDTGPYVNINQTSNHGSIFCYNNNNAYVNINDINSSGGIYATGTVTALNITAFSDYRVKTDVQPIQPSSTVDNLKPVTYIKNSKQEFGFLAHELQTVYPDLVYGEKDGEQMQSVNYTGLIALLTKEIQDLKARVKTLEESK